MNEKNMSTLNYLYAQKGELLTEIEIMQAQLQRINQQIVQIKNALMQQSKPEKKVDTVKKKQ